MPESATLRNACSGGVPPEVTDADFRLLVSSVQDYAIFLLDPQGCIASWNAGARLIKGYEPEEIVGQHFSVFYPIERVREGWPEQELKLALAHGRIEDEGWRVRKDGSMFWASVIITALYDDDGKHRGFAKVTRDLSDRRMHEELLRQSEERFRLMVESVRDYAIFMLDPTGNVVSWNLGAEVNKGYLAEEIIGEHFSRFYPPEVVERGWPEHELRMALRDGRFEDEGWRVRKDGTRFWANVVITALFGPDGTHRGFAKVTRDMTQQRRIDALEDEGRQLTRFLAVLGHELRNPMAAIGNAVSVMELEPELPSRLARMRDVLGRQVGHLRRLVDDLLDVGRIVSGKVHLERNPLLLQDVLNDAVEGVKPVMDARHHDFVRDLAPRPLWVQGDRVRLVQVVSNLLHNAAKFTPDGGRIELALRDAGEAAEISVRDNGPGIAQEHLKQVFELFAQVDGDDTARPHGGMGIGLSLVHQMVTAHDGEVSAFSTGEPGQGAEFVVRLPLLERS